MCIVLCSKGYPDDFKKNVEIKNLNKILLNTNEFLYHAGTVKINEKIFSIGGRVLNFVNISDNFSEARDSFIKKINSLNWSGGFFRKDIGHKVIEK